MPSHDENPPLRSVREVVDLLGGPSETAEHLGITLPAVSYYLRNRCFPPGRYLVISKAVEERGRRVDSALFRSTPRPKSETHAA